MRPVATMAAIPASPRRPDRAHGRRARTPGCRPGWSGRGPSRPPAPRPGRGPAGACSSPSSRRRRRRPRRRRRRRPGPSASRAGRRSRPGAPPRRVGRTSARFAASVSGEGWPAVSEWQAAQFCSQITPGRMPPDPPPPQAGVRRKSASQDRKRGGAHLTRAYPSIAMDAADKRLCDLIQNEFPVVERPYAAMGERLGMGEDEVHRAGAAPARRAHHPPDLGDLRHAQARLPLDARSPPAHRPSGPTRRPR